jgi:hypothetical protein
LRRDAGTMRRLARKSTPQTTRQGHARIAALTLNYPKSASELMFHKPSRQTIRVRILATWETEVDTISIDSLSASTEVDVVEAKETWSEYRLADGTVLRIKPVMLAISRVGDAKGADGESVYETKSTLVTDVRVARKADAA